MDDASPTWSTFAPYHDVLGGLSKSTGDLVYQLSTGLSLLPSKLTIFRKNHFDHWTQHIRISAVRFFEKKKVAWRSREAIWPGVRVS